MMNVEDLYRLLRTSHVQARGIVDTVSDPMLVLDASLCIQSASRSFLETFNVDGYETIGRPIYQVGNGQWDIPELRRLLTEVIPKSTAIINYEVERDFPGLGRRTMLLTARTLFQPDTVSHSMLLSIVDATDRIRREAAKDVLFSELRHRVNNLLAVVQSIARQTTTEGRTADEYRDAFLGRFGALIESQDLAFSESDDAGLKVVVERILSPFATDRRAIQIDPGPAVDFGPRAIMWIGLILHELATNAVKHGALSAAGGRVKVSWQAEEERNQLRLSWTESGGPPVTPPTGLGYGTDLIKNATAYNLGGQVEQTYKRDGLETVITVPIGTAHSSN